MKIFYDNTAALAVANDPKYHGKTKHIKKRYHYIRDIIIEKDVVVKHICTSNMMADPLTMPIARDVFVKHVRSLGLCRMYLALLLVLRIIYVLTVIE